MEEGGRAEDGVLVEVKLLAWLGLGLGLGLGYRVRVRVSVRFRIEVELLALRVGRQLLAHQRVGGLVLLVCLQARAQPGDDLLRRLVP